MGCSDQVANVYNRLILYPGDLFHASVDTLVNLVRR